MPKQDWEQSMNYEFWTLFGLWTLLGLRNRLDLPAWRRGLVVCRDRYPAGLVAFSGLIAKLLPYVWKDLPAKSTEARFMLRPI